MLPPGATGNRVCPRIAEPQVARFSGASTGRDTEVIPMDYLSALHLFVRAVETGSFSKAAVAVNAKTSTVSRAIASLEDDLGVSLFHRTTRRSQLTEPGATFYEQARDVLRRLDEARDAASAMEGRPQGLIRLQVPSAFARLHIMPFVPDFLATYPDIRLDVSLTDVRVDLLAVGTDLAIRIGPLLDSSLIARKLAPHRRVVCASPAYLDNRPAIEEPVDLMQHNCLVYTLQPTDRWFFRRQGDTADAFEEVPITGTLRADDSEPLRDAAVAGVGVVLLPTWLVGEDIKAGRLRHVLPGWSAMIATKPSGVFGVYPPHRLVPPKVRVFLDFAQKRFGRPPYWDPDWTDDRPVRPREVTDAEGPEGIA
jgi:DNA-binding transcriptional LysR family regulator